MEVVTVAVVVLGPLVAILLLLLKAIRKLMPQTEALPPWAVRRDGPPTDGHSAGDREPRLPLTPSRSRAVSLALPQEDGGGFEESPVCPRNTHPGSGRDERLAG